MLNRIQTQNNENGFRLDENVRSKPVRAVCMAKDDHCCYLAGVVCPFLRDDGPDADRRWVCTFRERLGSWEAVHEDPEYLDTIAPIMMGLTGVLCGDWPTPGEHCHECGVVG